MEEGVGLWYVMLQSSGFCQSDKIGLSRQHWQQQRVVWPVQTWCLMLVWLLRTTGSHSYRSTAACIINLELIRIKVNKVCFDLGSATLAWMRNSLQDHIFTDSSGLSDYISQSRHSVRSICWGFLNISQDFDQQNVLDELLQNLTSRAVCQQQPKDRQTWRSCKNNSNSGSSVSTFANAK